MLFHVLAMEKCKNAMGHVHSLETFGSVDGPGVRFVVFLQGCNMRCKYCHNPETWSKGGEEWTASALFERAWKYHNYWGKDLKSGGITVSGGEPLLQIDFVTEFFKIAKEHGVHTALDTSGQPFCRVKSFLDKFDELIKYTDLVILDLKEMDSEKHKLLTGHDNGNIFDMARYLSDKGVPMWIRHVLVPGLTDDDESLLRMSEFISELNTVERAEVLPYHTLGLFKWDKLGIEYPLKEARIPSEDEVKKAETILQTNKYRHK